MNLHNFYKPFMKLQNSLFFFLILCLAIMPDVLFAAATTGDELTKEMLDTIVKYTKWIGYALIVVTFLVIAYYFLQNYGAWADTDRKDGTAVRFVMVILLGILVLTVEVLLVTKGIDYAAENLKSASVSPVYTISTTRLG